MESNFTIWWNTISSEVVNCWNNFLVWYSGLSHAEIENFYLWVGAAVLLVSLLYAFNLIDVIRDKSNEKLISVYTKLNEANTKIYELSTELEEADEEINKLIVKANQDNSSFSTVEDVYIEAIENIQKMYEKSIQAVLAAQKDATTCIYNNHSESMYMLTNVIHDIFVEDEE